MRQQKFQSTQVPAQHKPLINGSISGGGTRPPGWQQIPEYSDDHSVELITPEVAAEMLKHNTNNRALSQSLIAHYAKEMEEGRWLYNKIPILFDINGVLLDGQHRLEAVVKSGFHMLCVVERNVDPAAFDTIDIHQKRTAAQIAAKDGIPNSSIVTALVRLLLTYDKGDTAFEGDGPSQTEVNVYAREHHQEFTESVRLAQACRKLTSQAVVAFCYEIFSRVDSVAAGRFFAELSRGGAPNTNPTFHLRERLVANQGNGKSRLERRYILALFFKAWNSYRLNRPMGILRWATDGSKPEPFPTL